MSEYKPGELFVYTRDGNCEHMELGQVKRKVSDDVYACWYSSGDTAARTNVRNMRKLANAGFSHVECEAYVVAEQAPSGNIRDRCSYCGVTVKRTDQYCHGCGRKLVG